MLKPPVAPKCFPKLYRFQRCPRTSTRYPSCIAPKLAHASTKAAPAIRRAEAAQRPKGRVPASRVMNIEEALPPRILLESARASGALQIQPDDALLFLRQYFALGHDPTVARLQKLCEVFNASNTTLTLLARVLIRSSAIQQKALAQKLLFSASALSDPAATKRLVSEALRTSQLDRPELVRPLQHLSTLALAGDVEAMVILGRRLESQGDDTGALEMFTNAADLAPSKHINSEEFRGHALVALGRLREKKGDREGAAEAFKRGADMNDGPSYFELAALQSEHSMERQVYLLKAASFGITEAAHGLGMYYIRQRQRFLDQLEEKEKRERGSSDLRSLASTSIAMAKEWLTVSATAGFTPSQTTLAMVLRNEGNHEEGMGWLDQAGRDPTFAEAVSTLREQWHRPSGNFDLTEASEMTSLRRDVLSQA
ncbi:MAG: hypothetical protein M1837_006190 [Sclerophora amabilis]|nr:MAG: hypothetical protein M1837_006190 [Sclerophora amabilis]